MTPHLTSLSFRSIEFGSPKSCLPEAFQPLVNPARMLALRLFAQPDRTRQAEASRKPPAQQQPKPTMFRKANAVHVLTAALTWGPLAFPVGTLSLLLCERRGVRSRYLHSVLPQGVTVFPEKAA